MMFYDFHPLVCYITPSLLNQEFPCQCAMLFYAMLCHDMSHHAIRHQFSGEPVLCHAGWFSFFAMPFYVTNVATGLTCGELVFAGCVSPLCYFLPQVPHLVGIWCYLLSVCYAMLCYLRYAMLCYAFYAKLC